LAELNAALKNSNVQNIVLEKNFSTNISVDRLVNIDLNNKTLTGNLSFSTTQAGNIKLGKGTVTGNLTVDTPNVSFTNEATVSGTTTIKDVANNTFTNNGSLQAVLLQDANGTRFVNGVSGTIAQGLTVDTKELVTLSGVFPKVIAKQSAKLNLVDNSKITNLNTLQGVTATVNGGTVIETTGAGTVDIKEATKYPQVTLKKNATYRVLKGEGEAAKNYYGIQARFTLPADQHGLIKESDKVVVSLMQGDKVLSTSTSKDSGSLLLSKYFVNEYANEKFYASTLFTPNDTYPSSSWDTTKWTANAADKPNRLKVEIKRNDKIVSSSVSNLELDEVFTDGISKTPLTWLDVLEENDAAVKSAILAVNTASDASTLKSFVEKEAKALKLDLADYNSLTKPGDENVDYGVGDRQLAVITDILANQVSKKAEDHWTVKQFRELFNAAVKTRLATQKALYSVNSAVKAEDLSPGKFLGFVMNAYKENESILVKATDVPDTKVVSNQLMQTIKIFESLEPSEKQAVLEAVYNGGANYASWGAMAEVFFKEFKKYNS